MGDGCRVEAVRTREEWQSLGPSWDTLLAGSRADTVFLTWGWLSAWVEEFLAPGRELFVLAVREGNELIGLAPWYTATSGRGLLRLRRVVPLGAPETAADYLDVMTQRGQEKKVAHAVYDYLFGEGAGLWDRLELQDVPAESLFLARFLDRLREAGKWHSLDLSAHCPTIRLPATVEELLGGLSPARRVKFKQYLRILERDGDVRHRSVAPADDPAALEAFFGLYDRGWGRSNPLVRPFVERYASRASGEERLQLDFLACGGKEVAALLHLQHRDCRSLLLMAADKTFNSKVSVGNVLVGLCLEQAVREGVQTYDFLKGLEDYKFHWANGGRSTLALSLGQRRAAPVLASWGGLLKSAAKAALR